MKEKKWNAGSIGLTFAGSFLGAGYVSGQELWQFFGSFGGGGLLGVLAAMVLLALLVILYVSQAEPGKRIRCPLPSNAFRPRREASCR